MTFRPSHFSSSVLLLITLFLAAPAVQAQYWVSFEDNTRYLALGDSLSAGYGAHPSTNGFVYQLYQSGAIDNINNTLLCNLGVPNATSKDVLDYQVPQAGLFFPDTGSDYRKIITLTVGGNDMLQVLNGANPNDVLGAFGQNLGSILYQLTSSFPDAQIYIANQYDPQLPVPGGLGLVSALNSAIATVVSGFPKAEVVDVFIAFQGKRGLLLIEKKGADLFQVHPTNAGYMVMAKAFADAINAK